MHASRRKLIIRQMNYITKFCDEMRELIQEQQQDIEKAFVMDSGPYRVRKEYKSLALQPREWVKMGRIAREKYLQKVSNASLHPSATEIASSRGNEVVGECNRNRSEVVVEEHKTISITIEDSGLSSQVFNGIWMKASQIVNKKGTIVDAPGSDNMKVVASFSSSVPHFVRIFQSGKVTCDCKNNASLALCAHVVAVADVEGCLDKFLDWYKQSKQSVNLWNLSKSSKVPKNPGAKPNQTEKKEEKNKTACSI